MSRVVRQCQKRDNTNIQTEIVFIISIVTCISCVTALPRLATMANKQYIHNFNSKTCPFIHRNSKTNLRESNNNYTRNTYTITSHTDVTISKIFVCT